MKSLLLLILLSCVGITWAQNSAYKGNLSLSLGLNQSAFLNSNIDFNGNAYNFSFSNSQISAIKNDISFKELKSVLQSQYNFSLGYTIRKGILLSFGIDNFRYDLPNQTLNLSGYIAPSYDQISDLSGNYENAPIDLDSSEFRFNILSAKYINAQCELIQNLYRSSKRNFVLNAIYGIGLGTLHSTSQVLFGTAYQNNVQGLSGFGANINGGLRFEFFKHIFIQPTFRGGILVQNAIKIDVSSAYNHASHTTMYGQVGLRFGAIFSFNKKNCDCPSW